MPISKSLDHMPQICFDVYLSYPVFVVFSHGEDSVSIPIPLNWAQRASTLLVVWYVWCWCVSSFFLSNVQWMDDANFSQSSFVKARPNTNLSDWSRSLSRDRQPWTFPPCTRWRLSVTALAWQDQRHKHQKRDFALVFGTLENPLTPQ